VSRFRFGQIVIASIPDGKGKTKDRPVVIIDNDVDAATTEILVICISTTMDRKAPYYHVQVHNSNRRDPVTGLSRRCWAKCNFAKEIPISRIKSSRGDMRDDLMEEIVKAFDQLMNDTKFADWQQRGTSDPLIRYFSLAITPHQIHVMRLEIDDSKTII
jgi:mRNA-degrading endonuclease toxin of MazEF toxin-antitoxin module